MTLYEWCIQNGEYGEQIIKEWKGLDASNIHLDIHKITYGSKIKALWQCNNCNYIWLAVINNRTNKHSKCPQCNMKDIGKKISKSKTKRNLYDWCIENDKKYIINEFVGDNIDEIAPFSRKKVTWRCSRCGYEWESPVYTRTKCLTSCIACSNSKNTIISGVNDLLNWINTTNNEFSKQIEKEWIGLDENNNKIDIINISKFSHTKVLWKCIKCGYIWSASPNNRVGKRTGCPACSKKLVVQGVNDLYTWCKNNDTLGSDIEKEFMGIADNGDDIDIHKIAQSSNIRVFWKCKTCNETWITSVNNRTQKRSKCPYCSLANTSFGEQIIYEFFKIRYSSTLNRHKYSGYEFDISIPELNTYIEYGSDYYHCGREQRDLEKRQLCENNNKRFIQVMQIAYKTVDIINNENNDIIYVGSDINKQSNMLILLNRLCNILNIKEVNKNEIEEVYGKVVNKYKQSREIVKSGNHS